MNVVLTPTPLHGTVQVPSSKSIGHRDLICAALADGESVVNNISPSQDIEATCQILRALGAKIQEIQAEPRGRVAFRVRGGIGPQGHDVLADAGESGSTLRFLIPVGIYSGNRVTFVGRGRLAERPLTPYYKMFQEQGVAYEMGEQALPLTVEGRLKPGHYALPGNVSSQFFTGLLMTLPLLSGDSLLRSTTPLESASYVNITLDCLTQHGITIEKEWDGSYRIPGNQKYKTGNFSVEGDYSQAAFWLAAGLMGQQVRCTGLRRNSSQGDEAIIPILKSMGGKIFEDDYIEARPTRLHGQAIDVEDCPDLVPMLTALAAVSSGVTHIVHAGRVRLKECDRLHAMAVELNKLGADIQEEPEGLLINGVPSLTGGVVSGWNDHRIAMALGIASQCCTGPLTIEGAECVRKSYPTFWDDFVKLGGQCRKEG